MADWHGYFAIEDLNLNDNQRDTLVDVLKALGPKTHPQPACLNHWRTRLDGDAAIFEALFDESLLTVEAMKDRLAAIFGISPATIDHTLTIFHFGPGSTPVVVFSRNGTDYLRMALFGGPDATWEESGDEVRAYLALFADQWELEEG